MKTEIIQSVKTKNKAIKTIEPDAVTVPDVVIDVAEPTEVVCVCVISGVGWGVGFGVGEAVFVVCICFFFQELCWFLNYCVCLCLCCFRCWVVLVLINYVICSLFIYETKQTCGGSRNGWLRSRRSNTSK
jgi:hypothetical protein